MQQTTRVAYIIHTFDVGGLERYTAHLCNFLDRSRFLPMIICLNRNGTAASWIRSPDVRIVELNKRPRNDLQIVRRLARVLRENRIDLVHSQNWGTLIETTLARIWARVKWHVHGEQGVLLSDHRADGFRLWLRARAMKWAFGRADAIVAVADSLKERIVQLGRVPEDNIHVIPNGVEAPPVSDPTAARKRIRQDLGIDGKSVVVGSVGRLAAVKDFGSALSAVSKLVARGHDVHLMLIGDGPEQASLMERAREARMDGRAHFVGRQTNVGDYLSSMDIYINSSLTEGTSLSILEAMASGLPLVVTDAGGNVKLIDGQAPCGLVAPVGDANALADALEKLIRDPGERGRLGVCAKNRYAEGFSAEHTVKMYQDLYASLQKRA